MGMGTIWYGLVALMLTVYVVLDGFDFGAGIVHLLVARSDRERRLVLRSIGPVWDGNEVWLLAAGGTLYFAFPLLYASSFSGFYLPLMMVLWLLILRGISIEFRGHVGGPLWPIFWDVVFSFSSLFLAVFFGAALGNVVRGVPLDANGRFFEPLWTSFLPEADAGILDWYTILAGLVALAALAVHGCLWVALKTDGPIRERAHKLAARGWWSVAILTVVISVASFRLQPHLSASFQLRPWGIVFPVAAVGGLLALIWYLRREADAGAFFASCVYLIGMLTSVAFGLYPYVLPSSTNPAYGLTVQSAKAQDYGLRIGLVWWLIGMALAVTYTFFLYRRFAGKTTLEEEGYGH
jgi:cytochrome d ubiquinol oxidase subunit II